MAIPNGNLCRCAVSRTAFSVRLQYLCHPDPALGLNVNPAFTEKNSIRPYLLAGHNLTGY